MSGNVSQRAIDETAQVRGHDGNDLKSLLRDGDPQFWPLLCERSRGAATFEELFYLSVMRKRAQARGDVPGQGTQQPLRLAMIGGYSLHPLSELVEHLLAVDGFKGEICLGDFDNYVAEMMEPASAVRQFRPEAVLVIPSAKRCVYGGGMADPVEQQWAAAVAVSSQLLELCRQIHEGTAAEILLANFVLPAGFDPGPYRTRTLGSEWSFRKLVNLELGLGAPPFVHICDLEFLAYRRGGVSCRDDRAWFESKQLGAADFLVDVAREAALLVSGLRKGSKKVLVLDLDNTLWGGVIGDDGLEGIEIGDTSARGEAFKTFQKHVRRQAERGILLAVASKNDHGNAVLPFEKHPDMVLRLDDFVSFKANWGPKSDSIRQMAAELNLGLDSFVFVDDNPAEIEIVRKFAPEVSALLLGPDPADYVRQLEDARLFEPQALTAEDFERTRLYKQEAGRKALIASATDMASYLASLEMTGAFREFTPVDFPRITQLINKSNQFNLTTRRRTECEVMMVAEDPDYEGFSVRLQDRFGDHGLIAVIIGRVEGRIFALDTWLMSCRVLNRQVEEEAMNEIVRLARLRGCDAVRGTYAATPKNHLVRDLYPHMGFLPESEEPGRTVYRLEAGSYRPFATQIKIGRRTHE